MKSPKRYYSMGRSGVVFGILFASFFAVWGIFLYLGMQGSLLQLRVIEPFQEFTQSLAIALAETPTPTPAPTNTPTPTPKIIQIFVPPATRTRSLPTPTPFPTPIPGRPGSKEWEENFWKQWDEMNAKNAAMQQQVEASQKKFCQENPNLCQ